MIPARYNAPVSQRTAQCLKAFLKAHRGQPFDLVHGFWAIPGGLAAVVAGMITRRPSILTLQGGEAASLTSIDYGNMIRFCPRNLTLWICRRADVLTVLTDFQAKANTAHGLRREMRIIPYGASDPFYCGLLHRALEPPLRLLHVADLNPVKDQETLLRAFRTISQNIEARLTVAGRDLLRGRIERAAYEMGIRDKVRFLGHVHHEQLPALYFAADLLLHTSLYEAQAVVVSEACAAGCVVCGTRVGLVADLDGSCTAAVPPRDPEALENAVVALARNPGRYRTLQSAATSWAEAHPAAWTCDQYSKLYEEISNF